MKICFEGFEHPILAKAGRATTIEIENRMLYARVCQSLQANDDNCQERFTLWEDGKRLTPAKIFLIIANPFNLPYNDRSVLTALYKEFESMLLYDDVARIDIESCATALTEKIENIALDLLADYEFALSWSLTRYLKAFSFGIDHDNAESLLDNLINFMALMRDIHLNKWVVFLNLKLFFETNELTTCFDQAFFYGFSCILLENIHDDRRYAHEAKYRVDQDFFEEYVPDPAE